MTPLMRKRLVKNNEYFVRGRFVTYPVSLCSEQLILIEAQKKPQPSDLLELRFV